MIFIVLISILSIFLLGFKLTENKTPQELYAIYLEGEKIGTVKSKEEFNEYINLQEEKLKDKYKVSVKLFNQFTSDLNKCPYHFWDLDVADIEMYIR